MNTVHIFTVKLRLDLNSDLRDSNIIIHNIRKLSISSDDTFDLSEVESEACGGNPSGLAGSTLPIGICLFHVGAGTIMREIISSFREVSVGGGGHTRDSMISSVVFIKDARSGGSVR
ncbi:unnamed protein product, partial [Meganyctiphanes norvegica]